MKDLINYFTRHVVVRFIIAGGTSAFIDLVALYILNKIIGLQYLISAVIAFLIAFGVSFTLHKFWTFKSHEQETHKQAIIYFGAQLFSLGLNTLLMYIFVGHIGLEVIVAQVFAGAIVAFANFFISRYIVFRPKAV